MLEAAVESECTVYTWEKSKPPPGHTKYLQYESEAVEL